MSCSFEQHPASVARVAQTREREWRWWQHGLVVIIRALDLFSVQWGGVSPVLCSRTVICR